MNGRVPRQAALAFGVFCYAAFGAAFFYMIGFMGDVFVPRSVDGPARGGGGSAALAGAVDVFLVALFALQHSGMARHRFKRVWTRLVPPPVERSAYVLATSLVLALLFWQWRPLPSPLWDLSRSGWRWPLWAGFWGGWLLTVPASCAIDHLDLFGLRQVLRFASGRAYQPPAFHAGGLYRVVRHPILFAFVISAWSVPRMTAGHALFSGLTTLYIVAGMRLEERDLVTAHPEYADYRRAVPGLLPRPWRIVAARGGVTPATGGGTSRTHRGSAAGTSS